MRERDSQEDDHPRAAGRADRLRPALTPPPPQPPERPQRLEGGGPDGTGPTSGGPWRSGGEWPGPRWPPWFALGAFVVGLIGTFFAVAIAAAITSTSENEDSAAFTILATLFQSVMFVGTAVMFASQVAPAKAWHFGLRRTRFWKGVGWAALGVVSFYAFAIFYGALVQPDIDQDVANELGADEGAAGLIAAGVMVMVVAPVAEEIFFRGFFYRALRSRFTVVVAAAIDGGLFGIIHYNGQGSEGLLLVPPLAVLGFLMCLVYERTGSLFPVIAIHAFNNTVAYAIQADDGWLVSVFVGPLMLAACALVPRVLPRSPTPALR